MLDDEISIPYPEPGNTLIQEGGGAEAKVLFADWMEGKWDLYSDGYKAAADMLVNQLQGVPPEDRLICPLVFMYRHFVELRLKSLVAGLSWLKNKPLDVFHTHNISCTVADSKRPIGCTRVGQFRQSHNKLFGVTDQ